MKSYEYESNRDVPIIIVTHKDMDKIGEYLDINKCRSLVAAPAEDGKDPSLNCTVDDILRLRDLKRAHGLGGTWRASP